MLIIAIPKLLKMYIRNHYYVDDKSAGSTYRQFVQEKTLKNHIKVVDDELESS